MKKEENSPGHTGKLYQLSEIKTLTDMLPLEKDQPFLIMHLYREAEELPI